jgi:hypothetical protein
MNRPWQLDFYRRPLQDPDGNPLWELLLCDPAMTFSYGETCPQGSANAQWLQTQLQQAIDRAGYRPSQIEVFRPASQRLAAVAGQALQLPIVPRRQLTTLKQWLRQRAAWYPTLQTYSGEAYDPLTLDRPPPTPLPETLWGEQWRFAGLSNSDLLRLQHEPMPVRSLPPDLMPLELGLASTTLIPGIVIDGGRQALALAQWLQSAQPAWLTYLPGAPAGLILEAGLADRWVIATFDDAEVQAAARTFEDRKQAARGLHFLLVRPDESGITYTGLWLLQMDWPLARPDGPSDDSGPSGPLP